MIHLEQIPASVQIGEEDIDFLSIDELFRGTEYGDILLDRSRWNDFKPEWMKDKDFQKIIGVDANNLKHLTLTYRSARLFLAYCDNPHGVWGDKKVPKEARFSEEQKIILLLAAISHDWGEASVGDTPQPDKNKKAEQKEFKELLRIASETTVGQHKTFGKIFHRIEPYLRNVNTTLYNNVFRALKWITRGDRELFGQIFKSIDQTLLQSGTKMADAFSVIEKLGYHRTGLIAWDKSKSREEGDEMIQRLHGMAFSVQTHNVESLVKLADTYPPVFAHLVSMADQISEVYATDPDEVAKVLMQYQGKDKTHEGLKAKYIKHRDAWIAWRSRHEDEIDAWSDGVR